MTAPDPKAFLPLTSVSLHILVTLEAGPQHGYAIKRKVEDRTLGVVRLGAGTLYHALKSLARRALVTECPAPIGEAARSPRWRFYEITPLGEEVLAAEVARLAGDISTARKALNRRKRLAEALLRSEPKPPPSFKQAG
jgi:DNA-binding PadR family transcriptional regulator